MARLEATSATTADVFSNDHRPVLTIEPGERVTVASLDASGHLERQRTPGQQQPTMFGSGRGHCLTGPIEIRSAAPGDVLAITLHTMTPGEWGWTVAGGRDTRIARCVGIADSAPAWLLWDLDAERGVATESRGFVRPLRPFLGVLGVAPRASGEHSTIPPRAGCGGNIDCRELVAGSTLYLPVEVDGALLYLGDGHAAQGDGEVGGTAIECPMTTELTVDVVRERPVPGVHAQTPSGSITFGFDADLNAATGAALDAMVTWLTVRFDLDRATALALASVCVDLRITQIANETWGVHAVLAPDAITR
jgi:acetamidase/formamidase